MKRALNNMQSRDHHCSSLSRVFAVRHVPAKFLRSKVRTGLVTSLPAVAVLLGALLLLTTPALGEEKWAWFYAGSLINKWSIGQGQADVELSGTNFVAKLYENGELSITLRG